jgi:hypothetical protein
MKDFDDAISARLLTSATALYALVGGNIYDALAPAIQLPYAAFGVQGGGLTNDAPGDFAELVYQARGVARTQATANAIDEAISARLHNQDFSVPGWTLVSCMRETDVRLEEMVGGAVAFHRGALYRIRAQRSL